ncbi:hypothetical protein MtrunA17_Chr4g0053371 [Medicago truncatula]|uniref:Uncharacterized protein n=1 Tax=Medicago truncatula TaxID=3880 RepID=A0A396IDV0_MEDTR|nr:hypothetical protein MtrunA17_Chr4g0053371 [Medicago truncatula]
MERLQPKTNIISCFEVQSNTRMLEYRLDDIVVGDICDISLL